METLTSNLLGKSIESQQLPTTSWVTITRHLKNKPNVRANAHRTVTGWQLLEQWSSIWLTSGVKARDNVVYIHAGIILYVNTCAVQSHNLAKAYSEATLSGVLKKNDTC